MIIDTQLFLANPNKYDAVVVNRSEFEQLHTAQCIANGKAQLNAGQFITFEEFKQFAKDKVKGLNK